MSREGEIATVGGAAQRCGTPTFGRTLNAKGIEFEVAFFGPRGKKVEVVVLDSLDRVLNGDAVVD